MEVQNVPQYREDQGFCGHHPVLKDSRLLIQHEDKYKTGRNVLNFKRNSIHIFPSIGGDPVYFVWDDQRTSQWRNAQVWKPQKSLSSAPLHKMFSSTCRCNLHCWSVLDELEFASPSKLVVQASPKPEMQHAAVQWRYSIISYSIHLFNKNVCPVFIMLLSHIFQL